MESSYGGEKRPEINIKMSSNPQLTSAVCAFLSLFIYFIFAAIYRLSERIKNVHVTWRPGPLPLVPAPESNL